MTTLTATTTQVYRVFIKATPEAIWDAITKPEFTERYFYGASIGIGDGQRGARSRVVEGESPTLEYAPPNRLVHEWVSAYDPEMAREDPSRVTWEIEAR